MYIKPKIFAEVFWNTIKDKDHQEINNILQDLKKIYIIISDHKDIKEFLGYPHISLKNKAQFLIQLATQQKADKQIVLFLILLLQRKVLYDLLVIIRFIKKLKNEYFNTIDAVVRTVTPLSSDHIKMLQTSLKELFSVDHAELSHVIDTSLKGGIIISFEGNIIDGSLQRKMRILQETIG